MRISSWSVLTVIILTAQSLWLYAQNPGALNEKTIELTRIKGFGPLGTVFSSINSNQRSSSERVKLYPTMGGIPDVLSNVANYYYVFQQPQFDYQNYKEKKITFEQLSESFKTMGLNLKDTSQLSMLPVRCGIGALTGVNQEGDAVYMVDCNNNHDFSDDVIRPLPKPGGQQSALLTEGVNIQVDFAEKGKIRKDSLYMIVRESGSISPQNQLLAFGFPEFRYGRFVYKNSSYLVCTENVWKIPSLVVLPDIPYFNPIRSDEQRISPGQFMNLGGDIFQFSGYDENGKTIRIRGKDISGIDTKNNTKMYSQSGFPGYAKDIKTAQVGFLAPEITGIDIRNGKSISLADLRGKYVYVDFWSTSCGPCIADFPAFKFLYDKLDKSKIEFLGMADERTPGRVKELNAKLNLTWPTFLTNKKETKAESYHIPFYPTSFLINPEGKIIHKNLRPADLENVLRQLL